MNTVKDGGTDDEQDGLKSSENGSRENRSGSSGISIFISTCRELIPESSPIPLSDDGAQIHDEGPSIVRDS
ncbi:hypothetical protein CDAR_442831 [Caerostris darwini]|uniref:Uncharacterized protein n=1 Tax=Caerostris darwini TaxID=1538125 RepID=A0AAV4VMH5_9ARAC|nr:hypothetical protein CDAR_442831 [Caerostris darwini]